jgi:hypothetical protein
MTRREGGCHCGAVRIAIEIGDDEREVLDCNCSVCANKGLLHLIVPETRFTLLRGDDRLATYTFGTHVARHMFWASCSIQASTGRARIRTRGTSTCAASTRCRSRTGACARSTARTASARCTSSPGPACRWACARACYGSGVSTRHVAETKQMTIAVAIDCAYCGYAGIADVRSTGKGEARSFVGLDRGYARDVAAERAHEDLTYQASVTASLLRCPQCARRARTAVVSYLVGTVVRVLALGALAAFAWWAGPGGFWHWFGPAAIGFSACAVAASRYKRFVASATLVERVHQRPQLPAATALKLASPPPRTALAPEPHADCADTEPKLLG